MSIKFNCLIFSSMKIVPSILNPVGRKIFEVRLTANREPPNTIQIYAFEKISIDEEDQMWKYTNSFYWQQIRPS